MEHQLTHARARDADDRAYGQWWTRGGTRPNSGAKPRVMGRIRVSMGLGVRINLALHKYIVICSSVDR